MSARTSSSWVGDTRESFPLLQLREEKPESHSLLPVAAGEPVGLPPLRWPLRRRCEGGETAVPRVGRAQIRKISQFLRPNSLIFGGLKEKTRIYIFTEQFFISPSFT